MLSDINRVDILYLLLCGMSFLGKEDFGQILFKSKLSSHMHVHVLLYNLCCTININYMLCMLSYDHTKFFKLQVNR